MLEHPSAWSLQVKVYMPSHPILWLHLTRLRLQKLCSFYIIQWWIHSFLCLPINLNDHIQCSSCLSPQGCILSKFLSCFSWVTVYPALTSYQMPHLQPLMKASSRIFWEITLRKQMNLVFQPISNFALLVKLFQILIISAALHNGTWRVKTFLSVCDVSFIILD